MAPATPIFYSKFFIKHDHKDVEAVVELKVWEVEDLKCYPDGLKYSLYCVALDTHEVIVGFDNHYPKGHHIHVDQIEQYYFFENVEKLVEDFYTLVRSRGYSI